MLATMVAISIPVISPDDIFLGLLAIN